MIYDSSPWKSALARDAALLARWAAKSKPTERRSVLIEKKIFISAYALRKLDDATALSTALLGGQTPVTLYPNARRHAPGVLRPDLGSGFDFEKPRRQTLQTKRLLDIIVHSLVFAEALAENGAVTAFLVTSDRTWRDGLYEVAMADFIELMRRSAADDPTYLWRRFDEATGRVITWAGHQPPPGVTPPVWPEDVPAE